MTLVHLRLELIALHLLSLHRALTDVESRRLEHLLRITAPQPNGRRGWGINRELARTGARRTS